MKSFEHLIITRFNLNLYARDKHDAPTRTERWLEHRFEIFERYCLPSVAAQTNLEFQVALSFRRGDVRGLPPPHRRLPVRLPAVPGRILQRRAGRTPDRKSAHYDFRPAGRA